jgi:hypothetical protein
MANNTAIASSNTRRNGFDNPSRRRSKKLKTNVHILLPHPAIMAMEATAPPTLDTLSAIPAVPPKIAWVMLGIKSKLMMKAMKTIVQGIRLASHISIE